jgi:putative DNA primase/helicase
MPADILKMRETADRLGQMVEGAQESANRLTSNGEHLQPSVSTFDGEVMFACGSDLTPRPVEWLWRDWLPRGKFCVLAGAAGVGKTTLTMSIAATRTIAGRWPDGSRSELGSVVIWSGEDDPADTLLPRFVASGGDINRVFFITGARVDGQIVPFDPARDMVQLVAAMDRIGHVDLVIVDPVVSAVTGDSHKNTEVRRALQPLVDLASHTNACVLGISHFSKGGQGGDPTQRVIGSVAFGAVARVVLVAAKVKSEDGEGKRILARSKSNIGPDDGGFQYSLEQLEAMPGIEASRVVWGESVMGSARELLTDPSEEEDGAHGARDAAEEFLRELLTGGPVPSKKVKSDALEAGHAFATVRRAADSIGVLRKKGGMDAGWYWSLAEGAQNSSKVPTPESEHVPEEVNTFVDAEGF